VYNGFMQKIRSVFRLWQRETEMPFMVFLTLVFVFIYIWTVINASRLHDPLILIFFTILFNLHLILHWTSLQWLQQGRSLLLYLGLQSVLIFGLVWIAGDFGPLFGLYLGIIGEAVGLLQKPARIAAGVAWFLVLSAINYLLLTGGTALQWWMLAVFPMTFFVIMYVVLYSRQAEARLRAQDLLAELTQANRQLTEYAGRIEDLTLMNERARMARELHDTLAQGLAGLILQLEAADSHLTGGQADRARGIIEQAMARARTTLADSRRVIDDLRSGRWETMDLTEAVFQEVDRFRSTSGIPCALQMDLPDDLDETRRDLVYRAVAEGLSNILRHAGARAAAVSIATEAGAVTLEIRDDGAGFDPALVPSGHYGLLGLRERARAAGGAMEILSRAGEGVLLRLRLPLAAAAGDAGSAPA
jgi:two-component system, NarL family, sensor histidine kinase YdfH